MYLLGCDRHYFCLSWYQGGGLVREFRPEISRRKLVLISLWAGGLEQDHERFLP